MQAVSSRIESRDREDAPATERVPPSSIERLLSVMQADPPEDTVSRMPSIDLMALATGAEDNALEAMRALYAAGETDKALALAASIRAAIELTSDDDPFGGLIVVEDDDELALGDDDIEEIDQGFLSA